MIPRLVGWLSAVFLCGCRSSVPPPPPAGPNPQPAPAVREWRKIDAPGLHNVFRVSDKLLSGSSPEGDAGFRSLQTLGVRTILSVDGAKPETEPARKFGMRYVHIPIGYDGVTREQALRLAKAVRDLPGLIYLHCHHGKHRGPAAAAVANLCVDERCTVADALDALRRAGTGTQYTGLWAAPALLRRPTAEELDRLPADFPETVAVSGLVEAMVALDARWDRVGLVRAAGWKVPPAHPDVDPPHEALQLREAFREMMRLPDAARRPEDFRRYLVEGERAADELEIALRGGVADPENAFTTVAKSCTDCHARYRNVPGAAGR